MSDLSEAVLPGRQVRVRVRDHYTREREATTERLSHHDHVGHDAVVVHREHLAAAAPGRLHLVRDKRALVPVANLAQYIEVAGWRRHHPAVCLVRLNDDASYRPFGTLLNHALHESGAEQVT